MFGGLLLRHIRDRCWSRPAHTTAKVEIISQLSQSHDVSQTRELSKIPRCTESWSWYVSNPQIKKASGACRTDPQGIRRGLGVLVTVRNDIKLPAGIERLGRIKNQNLNYERNNHRHIHSSRYSVGYDQWHYDGRSRAGRTSLA